MAEYGLLQMGMKRLQTNLGMEKSVGYHRGCVIWAAPIVHAVTNDTLKQKVLCGLAPGLPGELERHMLFFDFDQHRPGIPSSIRKSSVSVTIL